MAKAKQEKVELQDKQEKVSLDLKKEYKFESNGKSPYMPKGEYVVSGEQAELFIKLGYGDICL